MYVSIHGAALCVLLIYCYRQILVLSVMKPNVCVHPNAVHQEFHPKASSKFTPLAIERQTSYYYAHAKKEGESEAHNWDRSQEPKLLSVSKLDEKPKLERITNFSWSDDGADIKIYIFHCNLGPVSVANDNLPLR